MYKRPSMAHKNSEKDTSILFSNDGGGACRGFIARFMGILRHEDSACELYSVRTFAHRSLTGFIRCTDAPAQAPTSGAQKPMQAVRENFVRMMVEGFTEALQRVFRTFSAVNKKQAEACCKRNGQAI